MKYNENLGYHIIMWCAKHNASFVGLQKYGFVYRADDSAYDQYMSFDRFQEAI